MSTKLKVFTFLLLTIFSACKKKEQEETDGLYSVSGYIISNGQPVANAEVKIDDLEQYKDISDENGYFKIDNVSKRSGTLYIEKKLENGTNSQETYPIEVNADLNLNYLKLPNPVSIIKYELDSTTNKLKVIWDKSSSEEFREYKLYSHPTAGLDETTGTLEYVGTVSTDTSITLGLNANQSYYIRVYVMDDYGKLGGSNIISVKSNNPNLFSEGSFNSTTALDAWSVTSGSVEIDYNDPKEGIGSLHIYSAVDSINNPVSQSITTTIMKIPLSLAKNKDYKISFYYKAQGLAHMMFPLDLTINQNNENLYVAHFVNSDFNLTWVPNSPMAVLENNEWKYFESVFSTTSDAYALLTLYTGSENFWIDQLTLKINE